MTGGRVIGIGNEFRRDDGIGPALVARLAARGLPGVRLTVSDGEPTHLLEAWAGRELAVVVDAVHRQPATPGRAPRRLVVLAVEAADTGYGPGLSPAVRAALPWVVRAVLAELRVTRRAAG
ncbi:hydrogenase maturation protease [Geodermatophilus ruber]|uniref:Hydrogenase maturation protease n=1 Tax=Geodermatophilus ruber TaxID=504800 RepID=A0A1I4CBL4_9ACTN|nr:hydrogenase maturation protease [Geodermatophilus ruber]SFK77707.1 hydrogenase maturation protease [Geodermatophilus ruber]